MSISANIERVVFQVTAEKNNVPLQKHEQKLSNFSRLHLHFLNENF